MIHIIWQFRIKEGKRKQFEAHYGSTGSWALLFRKSPAYRGTMLVRDLGAPERYVVTDLWEGIDSFPSFREQFDSDYVALDRKCEEFTEEERCLGCFEAL